VRENSLNVTDLVLPLFVIEGNGVREDVPSLPGVFRLSIDEILKECRELVTLGIPAILLFPCLSDPLKDKKATESANDNGLLQRCIKAIKEKFPELLVMGDVAMDPYSSDGHDGYLSQGGEILNDETWPILAAMALSQARAGVDFVAPSDMMDGRVGYLRQELDDAGFDQVGILSYSAKYASSFYGPFRDVLDSAPKAGDKKTYQMDPANLKEALREARLDIEEGADILMVKPGLPYLDVLKVLSDSVDLPVAVYNVSGEYLMIKALAEKGVGVYEDLMMEVLLSFKRAGADMIFTYHAKDAARLLKG
jgi:porphobilinogen synthase